MIKRVVLRWCNACNRERLWAIVVLEPGVEIMVCWPCFQAKCLMYAHTELKGEACVLERQEIPPS